MGKSSYLYGMKLTISMKRQLFTLLFLLCTAVVWAVPAHPGMVKVQQPDGSYVTLRLLGDEWRHFQTTSDGYSVVKNSRGYYVYAEKKDGQLQPTAHVAHDEAQRTSSERAFLTSVKKYLSPEMTEQTAAIYQQVQQRQREVLASRRAQGRRATNYDKFRGLIILVEFNDKEFSRPDYKDIITDMVNKENYTGFDNEKYTGSVRDYFSDNSGGKFQPKFDVVGPYKVDFSQYDCNSEKGKCPEVLIAAIDSADVDVNFKDYDGDGNGRVDLVYFIIAGNGANYGGNDANLWWPHRSAIFNPQSQNPYVRKDGVLLWDYASSVELTGYLLQPQTVKIDGIGTICHEFSHVLGLPDFYDTNYEEDGISNDPGDWSVMSGGSYLNDSRTPAGYSLFERRLVGFIEDPVEIASAGNYTLEPLHTSFTGFSIQSLDKNELFLFENRQKKAFKWDAYLPGSGMLVHRVDKSDNKPWNENRINANSNHNYYEVVRADGAHTQDGRYYDTAADVFPGSKNVRELHNATSPANLMTWSGKASPWGLFDIQMTGNVITFEVRDALKLESLSLQETASVGVGFTMQLEPVLNPDYAFCTLTWTSSNKKVATVDDNGVVRGVSTGTCTITATSNSGHTASCELTVVEWPYYSVSEFKAFEPGTEAILSIQNAEALLVSGGTAFIRDASGCIMLSNADLGLKTNDVVSGKFFAQVGSSNNMPQAIGTARTSADFLTISSGSEPAPREVALSNLSENDYCDYVLVKGAMLVSKKVNGKSGVYAEMGDRSVRFFNSFKNLGISKTVTMPKSYVNKYYDIRAIYGTFASDGQIVDALYLFQPLTEVDAPTGISEIRGDAQGRDDLYNLQGQRIGAAYRGLLIRNGRKYLNK